MIVSRGGSLRLCVHGVQVCSLRLGYNTYYILGTYNVEFRDHHRTRVTACPTFRMQGAGMLGYSEFGLDYSDFICHRKHMGL